MIEFQLNIEKISYYLCLWFSFYLFVYFLLLSIWWYITLFFETGTKSEHKELLFCVYSNKLALQCKQGAVMYHQHVKRLLGHWPCCLSMLSDLWTLLGSSRDRLIPGDNCYRVHFMKENCPWGCILWPFLPPTSSPHLPPSPSLVSTWYY